METLRIRLSLPRLVMGNAAAWMTLAVASYFGASVQYDLGTAAVVGWVSVAFALRWWEADPDDGGET